MINKKVFRVDHYSSGMCNEYEFCTRVIGPEDKTEEQFLEDVAAAKAQYEAAQAEYKAKYELGMPEHLKPYWKEAGASYGGDIPRQFVDQFHTLPYRELINKWAQYRKEAQEYRKLEYKATISFRELLKKYGYEDIDDLEDQIYTDIYWFGIQLPSG